MADMHNAEPGEPLKTGRRVLRPPGGGGSDIFGVDESMQQQQQPRQQRRGMDGPADNGAKFEHVPISAADNKKRQQQGSGIFGNDVVDEPHQRGSRGTGENVRQQQQESSMFRDEPQKSGARGTDGGPKHDSRFEHVPISADDNKKRQQQGSGIFGDVADEPNKSGARGTGVNNPGSGDHQNPITHGKSEEQIAEELLKNSPSTRKGQGVFRPAATGNPLTGAGYAVDADHYGKRQSPRGQNEMTDVMATKNGDQGSRARQPPGGKSTALW